VSDQETGQCYVIRGPLGYYAGPVVPHPPGETAPAKWVPEPSRFWLFGSEKAARTRIRERGFSASEAWPEPYIDFSLLDPGIRRTVAWLRGLGFETTDSGDGVSKHRPIESPAEMVRREYPRPIDAHEKALICDDPQSAVEAALVAGVEMERRRQEDDRDTECAETMPNVYMRIDPSTVRSSAGALVSFLAKIGIKVAPQGREGGAWVQVTYDPCDESCILSLHGVDDSKLPKEIQ